jgi:hypothetical protein
MGMKNIRLALIVILAQLLPFAASADTCSAVYVASLSAVTVYNKTEKTVWVNMGDSGSKDKESTALRDYNPYGYKELKKDQSACFKFGVRGNGLWVREAGHNDALFFPVGNSKVKKVIPSIKTINILPGKGVVPDGLAKHRNAGLENPGYYKWRVTDGYNSRREQTISNKIVELVGVSSGRQTTAWVDYVGMDLGVDFVLRKDRNGEWLYIQNNPERVSGKK